MARDEQALKVVVAWAENSASDRAAVPAALRASGWTATYSVPGGEDVQRERWNQLLCDISALFTELNQQGVLEWDARVDYRPHALVRVGSDFYQSIVSTGPDSDNAAAATDPTAAGQVVWFQQFDRTPSL